MALHEIEETPRMTFHAARRRLIAAASVLFMMAAMTGVASAIDAAAVYHSPWAVVVAPDGKTLFASDKTAGCVVVVDLAAGKAVREIAVGEEPLGLALTSDGKTLFVALRKAGAVAAIDTAKREVVRRVSVGPWPVAVVLGEKTGRLFTCNRGDHSVSVVDLAAGKEIKRIGVVRDPGAAALTPDQGRLIVANMLPSGASSDPSLASEISVIDAAKLESIARIKLLPGSTIVPGAAVSPDGRWAYVVHTLGRFKLPISQLERGWVHTFALTILDLRSNTRAATVLLDDISAGAADPWDVVVSRDGQQLAVSHAGTHEVSLVAIGKLHSLLQGNVPAELAALKDGSRENIWMRIKQDRSLIPQLANDLTALRFANAIRRVPCGGQGPHGMALAPDGKRLYVANYFSGTIGSIDPAEGKLLGTVAVGPQPAADAARRGELYFHDATRCFQSWHSCASCHPDGRVDGLTWDFLRDGIGNGKDVISLAGMMQTSPHNRRATRATPRECMRTGVTGSHFVVPEPSDVDDLLAYVATLVPEPNPAAADFAKAAKRGQTIFEGKAGCAGCHPAPLFTDCRMHNVGILTDIEPDGKYDTPSLRECYRTAPYYHDGRAATLEDAMLHHGREGRHGKIEALSPEELKDLLAYLRSL
jgi:YVTN family beta-propeller protein